MYKYSKPYIKKICESKVYDVAVNSPLPRADNVSSKLKNNIFLKREDLQPTHSFKIRGAYNKIENLVRTKNENHVVTASAGNHAQGVAYSARSLKIKATIYMPKTTPSIKVDSVRKLQARVVLVGDNFDAALEEAQKFCKKQKLPFIHPFDDPLVIAGQGTAAIEIVNDLKEQSIEPDLYLCR